MKIIKNWIKNWATKKNIRRWNRVKKNLRKTHTIYGICYICNEIHRLRLSTIEEKQMIKQLLDFAIICGKDWSIREKAMWEINNSYEELYKSRRIERVFWESEKLNIRLAAVDKIIEMIKESAQ